MADTKISAMTQAVTPLTGDETIPLVQDGANVKATVSQVTESTYGEIYVAGGVTAQTLTLQNTYYKLTAFATDGLSNRVTLSAATDSISPDIEGDYLVQFFITFTDTNNKTFAFRCFNETTNAAFANTVVKTHSHSDDPMFIAVSSFIHINDGDNIIVQVACETSAGVAITVSDANFALVLLRAGN
jgi:hypothetical protein